MRFGKKDIWERTRSVKKTTQFSVKSNSHMTNIVRLVSTWTTQTTLVLARWEIQCEREKTLDPVTYLFSYCFLLDEFRWLLSLRTKTTWHSRTGQDMVMPAFIFLTGSKPAKVIVKSFIHSLCSFRQISFLLSSSFHAHESRILKIPNQASYDSKNQKCFG